MSSAKPPFRAVGTPLLHFTLGPSTSAVGPALGPAVLDRAYGQWAMRVRINGATSAQVQLTGSLASSSDPTSALRPFTTWDGTVNSSDDVVFVTGKPLTAVAPFLSLPSSSLTTADVWIAASA